MRHLIDDPSLTPEQFAKRAMSCMQKNSFLTGLIAGLSQARDPGRARETIVDTVLQYVPPEEHDAVLQWIYEPHDDSELIHRIGEIANEYGVPPQMVPVALRHLV